MYPMRFERTAFGVGVQRSIQLSYGYVLCGNLSYCTAETGRMSIEIYFFPSLFARGGGPGRALEDGAGDSWSEMCSGDGRLSLGGRRAIRWLLLSEIQTADSGTGPIHQERMMRSRFSGPCTSDVKSAAHPESAAWISLSSSSAALCPPRTGGRSRCSFPARSPPPRPPGLFPALVLAVDLYVRQFFILL